MRRASCAIFVLVFSLFAVLHWGGAASADAPFLRGDANGDFALDISDPITTLEYIFLSGALACQDAADFNDDGALDISDPIAELDHLFGDGEAPSLPGLACGPDPTSDALGCDASPCPLPPVASFALSTATGLAPLVVLADAGASFDPDGEILSYAWDFGDGSTGIGPQVSHTYTTTGDFVLTLTVTDNDSLAASATETVSVTGYHPFIIEFSSPTDGEIGVAVTRETILRFSGAIQVSSIIADAIHAQFGGDPLGARIHTRPGFDVVDTVTLFYDEFLPAGAIIAVEVDGDLLVDELGRAVDADGDGVAGGVTLIEFQTLSITPVDDTAVCGRVFASEFTLSPEGEVINQALAGATITADGIDPAELSATTDDAGSFRLEPVPAGRFFVHVDGRTVASAVIDGVATPTAFPAGPYYPVVGKTWDGIAGEEVILDDIYLPLVTAGVLVEVSATEDTTICYPDCGDSQVTIVVAADSLYADDGTRGGSIGIGVVNPDRLPGTLPDGLEFALVITVQSSGPGNFDVPVAVCFPNLPQPATGEPLAPGAKTALWSFDHDRGAWQVVGSMTVTDDGTQVCSDPGVGILAPGWHSWGDGVTVGGGETTEPPPPGDEAPCCDAAEASCANPCATDQEPVCDDGDADAVCKLSAGDDVQVYLHNGEVRVDRTDIVIPGRDGFDFQLTRTYRSRALIATPFGDSWDSNLLDRLYPQKNGDVIRCNGSGHIDTWRSNGGGGFDPPAGHFSTLVQAPNGEFTLGYADGSRKVFHADGRLAVHADRKGNSILQFYDAAGNLDTVVDTYGREYRFSYSEIPGVGTRLCSFSDSTGRTWSYECNDEGQLASVCAPAEDDESAPRCEDYYYCGDPADEALRDNLCTITCPEEEATGGPPRWTCDYGLAPLDPDTFDRCTAIHVGGGAANSSGVPAGGTASFAYQPMNSGAPLGDPTVIRGTTLVTKPNGNQVEFAGNESNHRIKVTSFSEGDRPDEPATWVHSYEYTPDGQETRHVFPQGNEVRTKYGTTSRAAERYVVEVRAVADAARGGGEDLVTRYAREPLYNKVVRSDPPRENATEYVPPLGEKTSGRYSTRTTIDYQEGTLAEVLELAASLGVSLAPRYAGDDWDGDGSDDDLDEDGRFDDWETLGIYGLGEDLNGDGRTDQRAGNVVRVEAPPVILDDDGGQGGQGGAVPPQVILWEYQYNDFHQLVRSIDPVGNVELRTYHPATNPGGLAPAASLPIYFPMSASTAGLLASITVDAEDSLRRTSTDPPLQLAVTLQYDARGNITHSTASRGITDRFFYNDLDEVVRIEEAADVAQAIAGGELPLGTAAPAYVTLRAYDREGRLVRIDRENRDGSVPGAGAFVTETYSYDLLSNLVAKSEEIAEGSLAIWQYRFDANQNLTETIAPEGNRIERSYDSRDLLFLVTSGAGTSAAATTQTDYDLNGSPARKVDAEDNDGDGEFESVSFEYDGFDRRIRTIDPFGTTETIDYDPDSRVIQLEVNGYPPNDPAGAPILYARTRVHFDEAGRAYKTLADFFAFEGYTQTQFVAVADADGDGVVEVATKFDAASRPVSVTRDDGSTTSIAYDGANRAVSVVDAAGNESISTYDGNSNVVQAVEVEVATLGGVAAELRTRTGVFDALDRPVTLVDSAGQVSRLIWDSLDNLVEMSDAVGPLEPAGGSGLPANAAGNTTRFVYDGLGRRTLEIRDLREDGLGGNPLDTTSAQNSDGTISTASTYDLNSRLIAQIDDRGNETGYEYDALDRAIRTVRADGSEESVSYDRDSNAIETVDANGSVITQSLDALNRVVSRAILAGGGVEGTTLQTFAYDAVSRMVASSDVSGGESNDVEIVYDSQGGIVEERLNGAPVARQWSGDGELLAYRAPSGRILDFDYDALSRCVSIAEGMDALASLEWIGPAARPLKCTYGNGTFLSYLDDGETAATGFDAARRAVRLRAFADGVAVPFIDREYAYNRADRRTMEKRNDDSGLTDTYAYDSAYRLVRSDFDLNGAPTAARRDLELREYSYDGAGNRVDVVTKLRSERKATTSAYAAGLLNGYTEAGAGARTHDANGNLTSDAERTHVYDALDRLTRVLDASGNSLVEYRYFADGRRTRKTAFDGTTTGKITDETRYYYLQWEVIEERSGISGLPIATYVWNPMRTDELIQFARTDAHALGAATLYAHADARSSVIALTDSLGAVVERFRYDDFGVADVESSEGLLYLFQGQRFEPESGFYHFRRREYDPVTGRFVQQDLLQDPINAMNAYTFGGNDPITMRDPLGLCSCEEIDWLERERARLKGAMEDTVKQIRMHEEALDDIRRTNQENQKWLRALKVQTQEEWDEFIRESLGEFVPFSDEIKAVLEGKPGEYAVKKGAELGGKYATERALKGALKNATKAQLRDVAKIAARNAGLAGKAGSLLGNLLTYGYKRSWISELHELAMKQHKLNAQRHEESTARLAELRARLDELEAEDEARLKELVDCRGQPLRDYLKKQGQGGASAAPPAAPAPGKMKIENAGGAPDRPRSGVSLSN